MSAQNVIQFLAGLHGMTEASEGEESIAVDILTGTQIKALSDVPDGEVLMVLHEKTAITVDTFALAETLMVRHANAMSIVDGGAASTHYKQINTFFASETKLL